MIRISNDTGIPNDTKIIDAETGNVIKGVFGVEILPFTAKDNELIQIKLTLNKTEINIVGEERPCEKCQ